MSTVDINTALDAIFDGVPLERPPAPFILHRFLASDRDFCAVARDLQLDVRDPAMVFRVWQLALRGVGKPKLFYTGPKKQKGADDLTLRLMEYYNCGREQAEEYVVILTAGGGYASACTEFGVETGAKEKDDGMDFSEIVVKPDVHTGSASGFKLPGASTGGKKKKK